MIPYSTIKPVATLFSIFREPTGASPPLSSAHSATPASVRSHSFPPKISSPRQYGPFSELLRVGSRRPRRQERRHIATPVAANNAAVTSPLRCAPGAAPPQNGLPAPSSHRWHRQSGASSPAAPTRSGRCTGRRCGRGLGSSGLGTRGEIRPKRRAGQWPGQAVRPSSGRPAV
jgi:hypothetical protein